MKRLFALAVTAGLGLGLVGCGTDTAAKKDTKPATKPTPPMTKPVDKAPMTPPEKKDEIKKEEPKKDEVKKEEPKTEPAPPPKTEKK